MRSDIESSGRFSHCYTEKTTAPGIASQQNPGPSSASKHEHQPHPCSSKGRQVTEHVSARKLRLQAWDALVASREQEEEAGESFEMVTLSPMRKCNEFKSDEISVYTRDNSFPALSAPHLHSTIVEVHATVTDLEEEDVEDEEQTEESVESMAASKLHGTLEVVDEKSPNQSEFGDSSDVHRQNKTFQEVYEQMESTSITSNNGFGPSNREHALMEVKPQSEYFANNVSSCKGIPFAAYQTKASNNICRRPKCASKKRSNSSLTKGKYLNKKETSTQQETDCAKKDVSESFEQPTAHCSKELEEKCIPEEITTGTSNTSSLVHSTCSETGQKINATTTILEELSVTSLPQINETDILKMAETFGKPLMDRSILPRHNAAQTILASHEELPPGGSNLRSPTAPLPPPNIAISDPPPQTFGCHTSSAPVSPSTLPALQPAYPETPEIFDVSKRHRAYICLLRSKSYSDWSTLTQVEQHASFSPPVSVWEEGTEANSDLESFSSYRACNTPCPQTSEDGISLPKGKQNGCQQTLSKPSKEREITETAKPATRRRSYPLRNLGWDRASRISRDDASANPERSRLELDLAQKVILRRKVLESLTPEEKLEHPGA